MASIIGLRLKAQGARVKRKGKDVPSNSGGKGQFRE
jgi:hypothetical protein